MLRSFVMSDEKNEAEPKVTTHEPKKPVNWPRGHVRAQLVRATDVGVELTDDKIGECICVTIHGNKHYLHSTTARALEKMLRKSLDEYNLKARAWGVPQV